MISCQSIDRFDAVFDQIAEIEADANMRPGILNRAHNGLWIAIDGDGHSHSVLPRKFVSRSKRSWHAAGNDRLYPQFFGEGEKLRGGTLVRGDALYPVRDHFETQLLQPGFDCGDAVRR